MKHIQEHLSKQYAKLTTIANNLSRARVEKDTQNAKLERYRNEAARYEETLQVCPRLCSFPREKSELDMT